MLHNPVRFPLSHSAKVFSRVLSSILFHYPCSSWSWAPQIEGGSSGLPPPKDHSLLLGFLPQPRVKLRTPKYSQAFQLCNSQVSTGKYRKEGRLMSCHQEMQQKLLAKMANSHIPQWGRSHWSSFYTGSKSRSGEIRVLNIYSWTQCITPNLQNICAVHIK